MLSQITKPFSTGFGFGVYRCKYTVHATPSWCHVTNRLSLSTIWGLLVTWNHTITGFLWAFLYCSVVQTHLCFFPLTMCDTGLLHHRLCTTTTHHASVVQVLVLSLDFLDSPRSKNLFHSWTKLFLNECNTQSPHLILIQLIIIIDRDKCGLLACRQWRSRFETVRGQGQGVGLGKPTLRRRSCRLKWYWHKTLTTFFTVAYDCGLPPLALAPQIVFVPHM